jgi:osmoprotectant transport system ATP-binding protein
MGYVIQQAGLFPHRTVADNVATVPVLMGSSRRAARKRALDLLELVGLPASLASRYPSQLSGGQQQRVGVARALAADPPVMLMDEPFSAVDPVVRVQLQEELLRLQGELSKTIVFVTHDIDEAVKLGDRVGVLRVGGRLAQIATPRELLAHPADSFVAGFVGRDRGYRALGFSAAGELPLRIETVLMLGDPLDRVAAAASDGWVLVVDADQRPQGWLSTATVGCDTGHVTTDMLNLGGTLAAEGASLREALDAALSSPSGRGVIVRADGSLIGTVTASHVLTRIEQERAVAPVVR